MFQGVKKETCGKKWINNLRLPPFYIPQCFNGLHCCSFFICLTRHFLRRERSFFETANSSRMLFSFFRFLLVILHVFMLYWLFMVSLDLISKPFDNGQFYAGLLRQCTLKESAFVPP